MFESNCNFIRLAGAALMEKLEQEFQYQMDLTDGCYVFWLGNTFKGILLEPPINQQGQAILQFFASLGCPVSMLRLGRSLSTQNYESGPVLSDSLAVKYLLTGFESLENFLFNKDVQEGFASYIRTTEFRVTCELILSYEGVIDHPNLCPEIRKMIYGKLNEKGSRH